MVWEPGSHIRGWFWVEFDCFFLFALVLAIGLAVTAHRLFDDGRDGFVEHVIASDGPRSLAPADAVTGDLISSVPPIKGSIAPVSKI